jgi:hypothetical protein
MKLLSVGHDAKTVKGEKLGVMTAILYLAPHNLSGYQVCPKASEGCKAACLYTAGMGIYKNVQAARVAKTKRFFEERDTFMADIVKDIFELSRKAAKAGMIPTVRLNGTSDIAWEKIACVKDGITYKNVMLAFPEIAFYDYSKVIGRKAALSLPNYHLTFSLAENNDADARKALSQGYNVAVVMNVGRKDVKPTQWSGYPVVNGDESDVRFNDPKGGHIVALTAKGFARKDTSGFVRTIDSKLAA